MVKDQQVLLQRLNDDDVGTRAIGDHMHSVDIIVYN